MSSSTFRQNAKCCARSSLLGQESGRRSRIARLLMSHKRRTVEPALRSRVVELAGADAVRHNSDRNIGIIVLPSAQTGWNGCPLWNKEVSDNCHPPRMAYAARWEEPSFLHFHGCLRVRLRQRFPSIPLRDSQNPGQFEKDLVENRKS